MRIPDAPHAQPAHEVARELGVDLARGVAASEVAERRETFGANVLVRDPGRPRGASSSINSRA
ncbi:MAG TPA: cation-transporting P-type ATPase [Thermoanaerobaculia bacterium]|nr:cation-transporting P-type ATPase [Thermoanaerobaculia bacterium]